jgi:hypothetical protein
MGHKLLKTQKNAEISFITPTHARDIERFALLRRSMKMFSCDIPHLVFVDTEDLPLFKERFGTEAGLQLISTEEVLPKRIEARRAMWRSWKGKTLERVGWRLGINARIFTGWKLQQIVKIEALSNLDTSAAAFLDSDMIFCGPVGQDEFIDANNQIRLLETPAVNYEDFAFEVSRQILVGGNLLQPAKAFNYIHQAPRFLRRTGVTLKRHLEKNHKDWYSSFFQQNFPSEYSLLGYAARELEAYAGYKVEGTSQAEWCYNVKFKSDLQSCLDLCKQEAGRRKFLLIQSNLQMPLNEYLPETERLLVALSKLAA